MSKKLKEKAINIKGKDYVQVKDRVIYFNDTYKNGNITTDIVSTTKDEIIIKAYVTPDIENPDRVFTGYATGDRTATRGVDSTNPVENAETSAVGRALAMMGIGVIDSIASGDEVNQAKKRAGKKKATDNQIKYIKNLIVNSGTLPDVYFKENEIDPENLTMDQASKLIKDLSE